MIRIRRLFPWEKELVIKDNTREMHLIIFGALPPPRGGVTTHIERLIPYLEEAGIKFVVVDHSRVLKEKGYIISLRREPIKMLCSFMHQGAKVLHCPLSTITICKLMFLLFMRVIGIRLTITLVAAPEITIGNSPLKRFYMLALANFSSHIVAANRNFKNLLLDNGIPENMVSVFPAFIPPKNISIEKQSISHDAVEFCVNRKPLIVTYAYGPDIYNGLDLYGLDLIVQVAKELRADLPQAGFVVVIPEITNKSYFRELRTNIRENGLEPFFYFAIGNQFSFVPFLQYADLFIRATNTDGDALTLREALYCRVPSVASDVCYRPEETMLFHSRDFPDLCRAVRRTLDSKRNAQHDTGPQQINNAELFIDVFKRTAGLRY